MPPRTVLTAAICFAACALALMPTPLAAEPAEDASLRVAVFTGGQAEQWRFVHTKHFGEHLIFGPRQLNAARVYYYKGLTDYAGRFDRYLQPIDEAEVRIINLDREQPAVDFGTIDLLILDDVRAEAFEKYQGDAAKYLDGGGKCLVVAGQSMLGGEELQAAELPTINLQLLVDPPAASTPYERLPWTLYATESSWRETPVQQRLPVEIISQPDLVVYDRQSPAVGGEVLDVEVIDRDSFLASVPADELRLSGYHKVRPAEDAAVLATIGPDADPLWVRRGGVLVFTGHEMESAVRFNGHPSNASINAPEAETEVSLPPLSADVMLAAACELMFDTRASLTLPPSAPVGTPGELETSAPRREARVIVDPIDNGPWRAVAAFEAPAAAEALPSRFAALPEGRYRVRLEATQAPGKAIAARAFDVLPREGVEVLPPTRWSISCDEGGAVTLPLEVSGVAAGRLSVESRLIDAKGHELARESTTLEAAGTQPLELSFAPGLPEGDHSLEFAVRAGDRVLRRVLMPLAVVTPRGAPDAFVMISGNDPSHLVFSDLCEASVVTTAQTPSLEKMLPYLEQHGGIARAYGFQYPQLDKSNRFQNWKGEAVGDFSWADPVFHDAWIEDLQAVARQLDGGLMNPIVLFDDEPKLPMNGGWESAPAFEQATGEAAPVPERRFDDVDYLDRWTRWEDWRVGIWEQHYRRGTQAIKRIDPRLQTAVVVEGMGKDIYAGFDPARSQAGVDIYWYHIYPLNEPLMMVGHAIERGLSAMRAMGQDKPTWALLQNWANQADVPRVPSPGYLRSQYWMAIAHGAETVGFWPYTYGFWISPGSPGWEEVARIAERQRWLSPLLAELEPVREPIGLLYSTSQSGYDHLVGLTAERPQEHATPWHNWHANEEAFFALKASGLPFETVEESELIAFDGELPYRALVLNRVHYLRPEARAAMRALMDAGGRVFVDRSSQLELSGIEQLPLAMDEIFDVIFPAGGFDGWNRYKHRDDWKPIYEAHAQTLREALAEFDDGSVRVESEHEVRWNAMSGGAARYIFVVNDTAHTPNLERYRDTIEDWRLSPVQWSSAEASITTRAGVVYDVIERQAVPTRPTDNGTVTWDTTLEPAGGRMFVWFEAEPGSLSLKAPETVRPGETVALHASLLDAEGRPLRADLPLTIRFAGKDTASAALGDGEATVTFRSDTLLEPGEVELEVTEPTTGLTASATVRVTPRADDAVMKMTIR